MHSVGFAGHVHGTRADAARHTGHRCASDCRHHSSVTRLKARAFHGVALPVWAGQAGRSTAEAGAALVAPPCPEESRAVDLAPPAPPRRSEPGSHFVAGLPLKSSRTRVSPHVPSACLPWGLPQSDGVSSCGRASGSLGSHLGLQGLSRPAIERWRSARTPLPSRAI